MRPVSILLATGIAIGGFGTFTPALAASAGHDAPAVTRAHSPASDCPTTNSTQPPAPTLPAVPPTGKAYMGVWAQQQANPGIDPTEWEMNGQGTTAGMLPTLQSAIGANVPIVHAYTVAPGDGTPAPPPPADALQAIVNNGSIPLVDWRGMNLSSLNGVLSGDYDSQIDAMADSLKCLGGPVMLRWFWGPNLWDTGNATYGTSRTDTGSLTNGSSSVSDPSITAADEGSPVFGGADSTAPNAGVDSSEPPFVANVTAGVGFDLSSSPSSYVPVDATATTSTVIIGTPKEYVAAWQYIWNRFRNVDNASNVAFVWTPSIDQLDNASEYYPGSKYVDWVSVDLDDRSSEGAALLADKFAPWYDQMTDTGSYNSSYNTDFGKPLMISELGAPSGDQANVFTGLQDNLSSYPGLGAVVYYDGNEGSGDWILDSPGQAAFGQTIGTPAFSFGRVPSFLSANAATFTAGVAGSFTPAASGAPVPSITESGTLPAGVTFANGILSGTPTGAPGVYPITLTAANGVSPNASQAFTLTIAPGASDFSVSVSPASGSVSAGSSATATVSTAVVSGSAETVSLSGSVSGAPVGSSVSFSPASVTAGGSSTMTIHTTSSTPAGTYPVTITGTAASGSHTATYTLTVTSAGPALYQAESSANTLAGGAKVITCTPCSGGARVGDIGDGGTLTFKGITVPTAGTYDVQVAYTQAQTSDLTADISANGQTASAAQFAETASWTTDGTLTVPVKLAAGSNTIEFSNPSANAPDIDDITVPAGPGPTVYEAESAANTLAGGARTFSCPPCSNELRVGDIGDGGTLTFNQITVPTTGTYQVVVAYAQDQASSLTADISVDGQAAVKVPCASTGSWTTVADITVPMALTAGSNTIEFSNPSANAPDIDAISVPLAP